MARVSKRQELIENILKLQNSTYKEWLIEKENDLIEKSIEEGLLTAKLNKEKEVVKENNK